MYISKVLAGHLYKRGAALLQMRVRITRTWKSDPIPFSLLRTRWELQKEISDWTLKAQVMALNPFSLCARKHSSFFIYLKIKHSLIWNQEKTNNAKELLFPYLKLKGRKNWSNLINAILQQTKKTIFFIFSINLRNAMLQFHV